MEITSFPDIPSLSIALSQNNVMQDLGISLLADQLQNGGTDADALTKMMELSVQPTIGANFDMTI